MKVAILQQNLTVGDLLNNPDRIMSGYDPAVVMGADIVVSTELGIFGYPPKDLLLRPELLDLQHKCLMDMKEEVGPVPLIVGYADRNPGRGKPLFNAAVVLKNKRWIHTQRKALLPTYDVFDEDRYFESNPHANPKLFIHKGKRIALLVCEDIWGGNEDHGRRLYIRDPVAELRDVHPDILITINASPYYWGKGDVRFKLVSGIASRLKCPVVYANQVGGNDDLIFDGRSFVCNQKGSCIGCAPSFSEELLVVDTDSGKLLSEPDKKGETKLNYFFDKGKLDEVYAALVMGTRDYITKTGFFDKGALIALSGGIDSALVACIAVDAIGKDKVKGIGIPSQYSSTSSVDDARSLAKNLGIEFDIIPISEIYDSVGHALDRVIGWFPPDSEKWDVTEENVQARIRALIMMAISNRTGKILLTTGNKSELAVGYCTLYGDMAGGFAVISDVPKTLVYELAGYINKPKIKIPTNTIKKPPSAELRPGQKDTDSLPPYDVLDAILRGCVEEDSGWSEICKQNRLREDVVKNVLRRVDRNEYKRHQMPPGLKVTSKAFGPGRRIPIAAKFLP